MTPGKLADAGHGIQDGFHAGISYLQMCSDAQLQPFIPICFLFPAHFSFQLSQKVP